MRDWAGVRQGQPRSQSPYVREIDRSPARCRAHVTTTSPSDVETFTITSITGWLFEDYYIIRKEFQIIVRGFPFQT